MSYAPQTSWHFWLELLLIFFLIIDNKDLDSAGDVLCLTPQATVKRGIGGAGRILSSLQ